MITPIHISSQEYAKLVTIRNSLDDYAMEVSGMLETESEHINLLLGSAQLHLEGAIDYIDKLSNLIEGEQPTRERNSYE